MPDQAMYTIAFVSAVIVLACYIVSINRRNERQAAIIANYRRQDEARKVGAWGGRIGRYLEH